ncbi:unnamed protein product [Didymodactylos carnosus]|uniref:Ion transport domain-containing protein n=1 Tax=Didymodactylos carnosus TaxID=1234261 RepID=A0A814JGX0_9BILA|nr:unnamed protein product [Didymodactylos carnosus]CAF1037457.1 unnamed protein product [Didymodactylos carnosus]CAF3756089.1 unnamed protein product [Didymodactylos carnosus]CAF3807992.1 unnamed protein product [Didymodactylos carnosus]
MKAIKIPQASLVDVHGKPVGLNSDDPDKHIKKGESNTENNKNNAKYVPGPQESTLTVIGETPLHIAIVYNDIESVKLLIKHGVDVNKRAVGKFIGPENIKTKKKSPKQYNPDESNYEGYAYFGEYPLAFAASFGHPEIYDYLIEHGADPNLQDTYGNTVLHMVIINNRVDMFKHAVRHPMKKSLPDIRNNSDLTPLTLAAKLGRKDLFLECLETSNVVCIQSFYIKINIKCSTYPLEGLDTITDGGKIDWNSSLTYIVNGKTEEHLEMLGNMVIDRLLNDKWSTFARANFIRQLILLIMHICFLSTAVFLRSRDDDGNDENNKITPQKIICHIAERSFPEKAVYQCSCILLISAVPFRILYLATRDVLYAHIEDGLLSLAIPGTYLFCLFFGRIYVLTGAFIVMIFEMITGDIATFGVIYLIVITTFGHVFFLLFRDTTEGGSCDRIVPNSTCGNDNTCSYKNFEAWMTMVHFTMGEFDFSKFDVTHYAFLVKSLFIVFMILTPILLLNMLIASMGNTYQRVIAISEKERQRQWAQLVLTIERSCSARQRLSYQSVYCVGLPERRDLMVIKAVPKTKAAQRKGAIGSWKRMGKLVLYLLKEQSANARSVRLRRVSHQSVVLKPKAHFDTMLETLAWERDLDLSLPKNVQLDSSQNTNELHVSQLSPYSPPPVFEEEQLEHDAPRPEIATAQTLLLDAEEQQQQQQQRPRRTISGDLIPVNRTELSEIRSRPSYVNYDDLDFIQKTERQHRFSMVPVDSEGYTDLLLDQQKQSSDNENNHLVVKGRGNRRKKSLIKRQSSSSSIKSRTSETTFC